MKSYSIIYTCASYADAARSFEQIFTELGYRMSENIENSDILIIMDRRHLDSILAKKLLKKIILFIFKSDISLFWDVDISSIDYIFIGLDTNIKILYPWPNLCHEILPPIPLSTQVFDGNFSNNECTSNNLKFSCNATSNGFLFTQSIIKELSQLNFNYVQITLDGNETLHNQIRYTADNHGSYRRIISNIILLVKYGIGVILRFNYTPDNIESIKDVAKEFSELSKEQRNLIHVSLHRVWQEADVDSSTLEHTISAFTKVGIAAKPTLFGEYCYADKGNSVVINYNGDLYKCTAVDFFNTPRDGYLTANGQLCWENDSLNYRISHMFSNKACHSCRIFPLCHGGCSTRPLKYPEGYCIMKYDEDKKDETILQRFLYKLRTNPIWQKVLYSSNLYKS